MGIAKYKELCEAAQKRAELTHAPVTHAILYIDGPIWLFCANSPGKNDSEHFTIADRKLRTIVGRVREFTEILKIVICFDGTAPIEKAETQIKRQLNKTNFDMVALKNRVTAIKQINKIPVIFNHLQEGEAERDIYINRDCSQPSVLYTKDSDIFSIAYHHQPKQPNDQVYVCLDQQIPKHLQKRSESKRIYSFYDMSQFFYEDIPTHLFRFLVAMGGTDFTDKYFSPSMITEAVNRASCPELKTICDQLFLPNGKGVELLYNYYVNFYKSPKIKESKLHKEGVKPNFERILWYLNYYIAQ
jgi:hypothetical protein